MQTIIELSLTFLKIGIFTIGGGYAMLPLIQRDVLAHGWSTTDEFANIVAISQMTPGPIGINCATYVGYKVAGVAGSAIATISVVLLPVMLSIAVSYFYVQFRNSVFVSRLLKGIRATAVALLAIAAVSFIDMSIFGDTLSKPFAGLKIGWQSIVLFVLTVVLMQKFKVKTIYILLLCGLIGIFIY